MYDIQIPENVKVIEVCDFIAQSQERNWGIDLCSIEKAWSITKGKGIKVAVLDTGISDHIDLKGAWSEDLAFNFTSDSSWEDKKSNHGTHVAGIIGARDNDTGVVGVAPECTIIPMKVLNDNGGGSFDNIVRAIEKAISPEVDADIITMSLGAPFKPSDPDKVHEIIKEATSRGKIVLAAAGNDGGAVNYPAKYDEVLAVAAVDEDGNFAGFTSSGLEIDSLGPGVNIYSTLIGNKYGKMSGTSQACPFIAGLCALILSHDRMQADGSKIKSFLDIMAALDEMSDDAKYIGKFNDKRWGVGLPYLANLNWKNTNNS